MTVEPSPPAAGTPSSAAFGRSEHRTRASYERELAKHRAIEVGLREALAQDAALLRQRDKLIQQQDVLSKESDHRFLNSLQMIVSLLSLQSRASTNPDVASQLAVAANRVSTIERVHRRLHYLDGVQSIAFKRYLEDLCRDFSAMMASEERPEVVIAVEGIEVNLPTVTAIPLGFIVNELMTNAAKYGSGRITIRLEPKSEAGYALSVSNDGPPLPDELDPAACDGLGMRIIRSLVERIGGELQTGRSDRNQGARFAVLFKLNPDRPSGTT
jgi:two-component sensor histidine kinase